jgi:Ca2+-binding EF-hand superfamily protein
MRRAGQNPTDIEVLDIINRIDDDTGYLDFQVSVRLIIFLKGSLLKYSKERQSGSVFEG